MADYTPQELAAIYELGRLYYEMGYFVPAERIFNGLSRVDQGLTASRIGMGLIKLENGLLEQAIACFRESLERREYEIQAKIGLAFAFMGQKEIARAKCIIDELLKRRATISSSHPQMDRLVSALQMRIDRLASSITVSGVVDNER